MSSAVTGLLDDIRARLVSIASEDRRQSTMNFFREPVDPYGVSVPNTRQIVRDMAPRIKPLPVADRNRLCTALMKSGKLEESILAAYVYARFAKTCGRAEFELFAGWAARYLRDWASCDTLCSHPVAACLRNQPDLARELLSWARSQSLWMRRAAAVGLVKEGRAGRQTELIFELAALLIEDPEEMVQKGVGWLLKETYPLKPRETVAFLLPWRQRTTRLLLRYAAEKMSAADRKRVLAK